MIIRKQLITIALFIGISLFILFSFSYIWIPLIIDNALLVVISKALIIILGLAVLFLGIMFYSVKKRNVPSEKHESIVLRMPATIPKISSKQAEPKIIAMPITRCGVTYK